MDEPVPIEDLDAETVKPGMIVRLEDGRLGRVASNLSIKDIESGLFIDSRYSTTQITPDNHRDYRERRYQIAREAAVNGVLRAVPPSIRAKTEFDAYAHMIGKQYEIACDPDKGRAATEAAKLLIKVLDLAPDGSDRAGSTTNNVQITVSEHQLTALIDRLAAIREQKRTQPAPDVVIIDAEVQ